MPSFSRSVAFAVTVLALTVQTACSSDGDDDEGGGGSSGSSSTGGSGGSGGGTQCGERMCVEGEFCSECFNPDNPDEPLMACITEGTSC